MLESFNIKATPKLNLHAGDSVEFTTSVKIDDDKSIHYGIINGDYTKNICISTYKSLPEIKRIIFNNPATIVYWQDGTKTVVKVSQGDTFNAEYGVAMAHMKKMYGSSAFKKIVEKGRG